MNYDQDFFDLACVTLTGKRIKATSAYKDGLSNPVMLDLDKHAVHFNFHNVTLVVGANIIALDIPADNVALIALAERYSKEDSFCTIATHNDVCRMLVQAKTKDIAERAKKAERLMQWYTRNANAAADTRCAPEHCMLAMDAFVREFPELKLRQLHAEERKKVGEAFDYTRLAIDCPNGTIYVEFRKGQQIQINFQQNPDAHAELQANPVNFPTAKSEVRWGSAPGDHKTDIMRQGKLHIMFEFQREATAHDKCNEMVAGFSEALHHPLHRGGKTLFGFIQQYMA